MTDRRRQSTAVCLALIHAHHLVRLHDTRTLLCACLGHAELAFAVAWFALVAARGDGHCRLGGFVAAFSSRGDTAEW